MKKCVLISLILNILIAGITLFSVENNPRLEDIYLNYTSYELIVNSELNLDTIVKPSKAKAYTHAWVSSDDQIASVDSYGRVRAKSVGECTISVKISNGEVLTCEINVLPIVASSIDLEVKYTTISVGYSQKIDSTVNPASTTFKDITWTSSDDQIVSVASDGTIVGVGAGVAVITAEVYGGVSETITICVENEIMPSSLTLSKTSVEIKKGKSAYVSCSFLPETVTNTEVTWVSSNPEIATVNNGTIVGVKAGFATITVRTANGIERYVNVKVTEIPVTGVFVDNSRDFVVELSEIGRSIQIQLRLLPTNTTFLPSEVTFISQDTSVARVSSTGQVTFVGEGTTYIIFEINGNVVGSMMVAIYDWYN